MNWYVIYVKPQNEKKVADTLQKMHVEVFCPMIKETKYWSDRKKVVETPLFKSYVFVKLLEKHRGIVFGAPGVVRYLFWLRKPAVVRDEEIEVIKKWMKDDAVDALELSKLVPGNEIIIKKGLFKDLEGIIQRVEKKELSLILKDMGVVVHAKIKELV